MMSNDIPTKFDALIYSAPGLDNYTNTRAWVFLLITVTCINTHTHTHTHTRMIQYAPIILLYTSQRPTICTLGGISKFGGNFGHEKSQCSVDQNQRTEPNGSRR